jgi:hypothetical protein
MTTEELQHTLEQHELWLRGEGGQRANLSECNLSAANLSGADLSAANMSGANLSEANLSGSDLRGADLYTANLRGADLSGSDLRGANLRGANLSGSDLRGADLRGSDLRGSDLSGSNLTEAEGIMQFGPMPTSGRIIYAVRHDSGWMMQAGCFWGTLDELEAAVKAKHKCPMYLGIIQLLRNTTNQ